MTRTLDCGCYYGDRVVICPSHQPDVTPAPAPRRATYRFGMMWVAENDDPWVAENDDPGCLDVEVVAGIISTLLVADLFGKDPKAVAEDIVSYRKKLLP